MKYREMGSTGISVSVIGLGTWQLGGPATLGGKQIGWGEVSEKLADSLLNTAFDQGINFYDTADVYGKGRSETLLGRFAKNKRDKIVIASKFGNNETAEGKWFKDFSTDYLVSCLDNSLKRLDTEYLDFYMLHTPNADFSLNPELLATLEEQKKKGKILHWGVSLIPEGRGIDPGKQGMRLASESKACEFFEARHNMLERAAEKEFFPYCKKHELGVICREAIASGFLSGKYKKGVEFPANDLRSTYGREKIDSMIETADKFKKVADEAGMSLAQLALKFCIELEGVTTVIAGARTADQIIANAKVAELPDFPLEKLDI
jgi:aryl-alcohol dehydrogenase-like predicted oxidoreductase